MTNSAELMFNRLIVLLQIILIPIYFIYFNIIWHDDIAEFFDNTKLLKDLLPSWLIWFEVYLAIPIFFSLPWILISIARASRIADSYTLMGRALGKVRIDQKLFYGINAAFTLIFLILPFGSPLITIIGVFIAFRIISHKLVIGRISKFFWLIPATIVSVFPILIAMAFYNNYLDLFDIVFSIWRDYIDLIFYLGLCLAIAITLGNFISFMIEKGVRDNRNPIDPYRLIYLIKLIIYAVLLLIYFNTDISVINIINIVAGLIAAIEFILRRITKLPSDSAGANLMVFAFILINFVTKWIKSFVSIGLFRAFLIVISGFVFFLLFLISYKYAEDDELIN